MKKLHVKVEYIEPLLGTASANPQLHHDFIADKAPDAPSREEEVEAIGVDAVEEKAMTVFPRFTEKDEKRLGIKAGTPCTWDYQWRGYFKESCSMLRRSGDFKSKKLTAFKKEIDGLVFVEPRKIPLILPEGEEMGNMQRPLRASTAQGERVALANSEMAPEGTTQEFDVVLFKDELQPYVIEWLEYGKYHGTGQWRNGSYGRFVFEMTDEDGEFVAGNM